MTRPQPGRAGRTCLSHMRRNLMPPGCVQRQAAGQAATVQPPCNGSATHADAEVSPCLTWYLTGQEDTLTHYRQALRMTNETFAEHLGVAVRTVAYWRARPDVEPRPSCSRSSTPRWPAHPSRPGRSSGTCSPERERSRGLVAAACPRCRCR